MTTVAKRVVKANAELVVDADDLTVMDLIDIEEEFGVDFEELSKTQTKVIAAFAWIKLRAEQPGITWREAAAATKMSSLITSESKGDADPKAPAAVTTAALPD